MIELFQPERAQAGFSQFWITEIMKPLSWVCHRMVIGRKFHEVFHLFRAGALNLIQRKTDRQVPNPDSLLDLQPSRQTHHQNLILDANTQLSQLSLVQMIFNFRPLGVPRTRRG